MECNNKDRNIENCTCTYSSCSRQALCCECIQYHLASRELPGCCFPPEVEKTYDRSFKAFAQAWAL